jgi:hypothetical protein
LPSLRNLTGNGAVDFIDRDALDAIGRMWNGINGYGVSERTSAVTTALERQIIRLDEGLA